MGGASLPRKVVKAFRSAGATEEMIASARLIFGSLPCEPPGRRGATLPRRAVTFRSAGATEEMIASARLIFGSLPCESPGRPRMYKSSKETDHAFYMRHRDRLREKRMISPKNGHPIELQRKYADEIGRFLVGHPMKDMAIAETIVAAVPDTGARVLSLKEVPQHVG
jgi:hypothetical protein